MADKDLRYSVTAEDRFSRTFASLRREISSAGSSFAGLGAAAGRGLSLLTGGAVVSVGAAGLAIRQLTKDLDSLNDASDATGSSVENLSALENVARRNGESLELAVTAVSKLNKALQEAKPGSVLDQVLTRIGLSAKELRADDPSVALQKVAVALNGYAVDGDKARIVQELFGKSLREVAPFLKDMAEAGQLNATVTAEQAAEAEKFNKQLAELSTRSNDAARSLVSNLIPALNRLFERAKKEGWAFALFTPTETQAQIADADALAAAIKGVGENLARVDALAKAADPRSPFAGKWAADAAALRKRLEELQRQALVTTDALKGVSGKSQRDLLREMEAASATPRKVGDTSGLSGTAKQVTEAERYLETLRKQGDALERLSAIEQLERDLAAGRIDGITPKIKEQLRLEADRVLMIQRQTDARRAQQEDLDALIERSLKHQEQRDAEAGRQADEVFNQLAQTPTGRRRVIERQVDTVVNFARANPKDAFVQQAALERVTQLRDEMSKLGDATDETGTDVQRLQVVIDDFAKQSTQALADFVIDGKGSLGDLFRSFAKDMLKAQMEDPVKDAMNNVLRTIRAAAQSLDANNPFEGFFAWLKNAFAGSGGGAGGGGWGAAIGAFFSMLGSGGGSTGRAGGGPVRAGSLVRWQENGREWFVPGQNGTVLNQGQLAAMQASAQGGDTYHLHINGDVSPQTVQLVRRLIDQKDAERDRARRFGRLGLAGA